MLEGQRELREAQLAENKRIKEVAAEEKRERKEEMMKKKEETLKDAMNKTVEVSFLTCSSKKLFFLCFTRIPVMCTVQST